MKNKNSFSIDSFINNKELNILKAVLPFVPPQARKFLAVYIAMNELSSIFNLLNAIGNDDFFINNSNNNDPDIEKIFSAIKTFLDPSEAEMAENYFNMINTMKMFNEMSEMFESDDSNKNDDNTGGFNMDMLKNILSPEQSAIFDALSNQN